MCKRLKMDWEVMNSFLLMGNNGDDTMRILIFLSLVCGFLHNGSIQRANNKRETKDLIEEHF